MKTTGNPPVWATIRWDVVFIAPNTDDMSYVFNDYDRRVLQQGQTYIKALPGREVEWKLTKSRGIRWVPK